MVYEPSTIEQSERQIGTPFTAPESGIVIQGYDATDDTFDMHTGSGGTPRHPVHEEACVARTLM